jgi:hypothetical protein
MCRDLYVEENWLAECAVEDVGEECRQVGWEEFVATCGEFGLGPPAVLDEAGLLVGGALGPQGGRGVGEAGEVDALSSVVLAAPVVEAGLAVPEVGPDVVEEDAGLLYEFAAGGIGEAFAGVSSAAGQFPPVVAGLIRVTGMNEQDAIVLFEQEHAGSDAQGGAFGGGGGHPGRLS